MSPDIKNIWDVEYDNDTGPGGDGFWEWWVVSDGERRFTVYKEADARWLAGVLNNLENLHARSP